MNIILKESIKQAFPYYMSSIVTTAHCEQCGETLEITEDRKLKHPETESCGFLWLKTRPHSCNNRGELAPMPEGY